MNALYNQSLQGAQPGTGRTPKRPLPRWPQRRQRLMAGPRLPLDLRGARVRSPPLLVDSGASIVTDEVTYPGLVQAVQPFSPRLVALRDTGDGRCSLESLRALLERGLRPAFVYTIPDGHDPLGHSLSAEDRVALAALANEFDIVLVEDDAYGFLSFGPHSPIPLVSLHPDHCGEEASAYKVEIIHSWQELGSCA